MTHSYVLVEVPSFLHRGVNLGTTEPPQEVGVALKIETSFPTKTYQKDPKGRTGRSTSYEQFLRPLRCAPLLALLGNDGPMPVSENPWPPGGGLGEPRGEVHLVESPQGRTFDGPFSATAEGSVGFCK